MKIFLLYMVILVHCQLLYLGSRGQERAVPCLANGDFSNFIESNCPNQTGSGCYSFTNACLPNWHVSNGSPQRLGTTDPYLFMWANYGASPNPYGEGSYAEYSFSPGQAYRLQMSVNVSGGTGSFYVYAANGLTDMPSGCGSPLQNVSTKQLIGVFTPTLNAGWVPIDGSFVADGNYTQLWIYPINAATTQYNLAIDWVEICPSDCATLGDPVTINQGILSPIIAANAIYAGSSAGTGGSGTVTAGSTVNTTLIANPNTDGIVLLPQFDATPSSGSFQAYIIQDCQPFSSRIGKINDPNDSKINSLIEKAAYWDSITMATKHISTLLNDKISVYPIPSKGKITVEDPLAELANSVVSVTDVSGKEVFSLVNNTNTVLFYLDLSKLSNGVYFLKINSTKKMITKKIIIDR